MLVLPLRLFIGIVCLLGVSAGLAAEVRLDFRGQGFSLLQTEAISCSSRLQALRSGQSPRFDVPPFHFALTNPELSFRTSSSSQTAVISSLSLRLDSPALRGGSYRCLVPEPELAALFGQGVQRTWDRLLAANSSLPVNPSCFALTCGNLQLVDETRPFQARLTVRVIGLIRDRQSRQEFPLDSQTEVPVTLSPK